MRRWLHCLMGVWCLSYQYIENCWNRTAPTKGTNGWYYNTAGGVCDAASGIASIELDATKKELVLNVLETASVGTIMSINVGFAINNGADFDDYIRFL